MERERLKVLAAKCLHAQEGCNPVAIAGSMHSTMLELSRDGMDHDDIRRHPIVKAYLDKLVHMAGLLDCAYFAEVEQLVEGRGPIAVPWDKIKFRDAEARQHFSLAKQRAEEMGGKMAESFQRCVQNLVGLEAEVSRDTDVGKYANDPHVRFLGWTGKGMVGGMVLHSDTEWSLHS